MDKFLTVACIFIGIAASILSFPEGIVTMTLTFVVCAAIIVAIRSQNPTDADFLVQIFLAALLARLVFGFIIQVFDLREFFGGDALTYDSLGHRLVEIWLGNISSDDFWSQRAMSLRGSGWGMNYLTGIIYLLVGRNIYAAQTFCAIIGAATAPMIYFCAYKIFENRRVAKISAFFVALSPAFIIWSGQLLKDGLVIFLLVVMVVLVLRLQEKLNYLDIILLIFSLFGILSLRFYIFYMAALAVFGAFVIGSTNSPQAIFRRIVLLGVIGTGLAYLGAISSANQELETFGNLERIQRSRDNLAEAGSGFAETADVSTTEGAIAILPIGFAYLMLAPFPWQATTIRQALTMPEMLIWWASIPLLIRGFWYTIKNRLRPAIAIVIFTVVLTLAYSVFQGNVGTAYRQRTQIQVFLFIFIGVGWTLMQEKKENVKFLKHLRHKQNKVNKLS